MFRGLGSFLLVVLATVSGAQGYSERWRHVTSPAQANEVITWFHVTTTAANEVVAFGTAQNGTPPPAGSPDTLTDTIILAKFDQDGNPIWFTRGFDSQQGFLPTDLATDAAGNVYVSYVDGENTSNVDSYASATGAMRWSHSVALSGNKRIRIAVRSAGNSTFVYAGASAPGATGPFTRILRFNAVNGGISHVLNVEGVHTANFNQIESDANGNVVFSALIDGLAVYRKVNQSLSPVWSQTFGESLETEMAFDLATNSVLSISGALGSPRTLRRLSGVNGSTLNTFEFPQGVGAVIQPQANVFGSWYLQQDFEGTPCVVGFTPSLKPFVRQAFQKTLVSLTTDIHGQAHFGNVGLSQGTVALRRVASEGLFEASFAQPSGATAVAADSLGRVILAGRLITGEAVLFQLEQPFLTNTDVIVRDFTGPLNIEAPGVLANDTNWVGGTLSVVTPPTEGTVTLNADGSFEYVPGANYDGTDQFQYRITKNGVPRTATCVVKQLIITQLTLDETSVIGQEDVRGTLGINNGTLPFQITPVMTTSSPAAQVLFPAEFFPGQTQKRFTIRTLPVNVNTAVTITASASGQSRTANLTLKPGGLQSITALNNAPLISGQSSVLVLRLTGAADVEQTFGILYQNGLTGPGVVTVPAGQVTKNFTVNVPPGLEGQTVALRGFAGINGFEFQFPVTAKPTLDRIETVDNILYAGTDFRVRALLTGQAGTSSISPTLAVNNATVTVPGTIFVQAGASSGIVVGSASLQAANKFVTFTSTLDGVTRTMTVLIRPNLLENFTVSPKTLSVRQVSTGTVFLNWVATGRGQPVEITTDKPLIVSVPSGITIPTGQTNRSFTIKALAAGTASVSVRIGDKKITQTLTITP